MSFSSGAIASAQPVSGLHSNRHPGYRSVRSTLLCSQLEPLPEVETVAA
jgi:hypothetical protein